MVRKALQDLHVNTFRPLAPAAGAPDHGAFTIDGKISLQIGYVNGFGYNQVLPAPDAELPERFQRAEQVFAQKLWRKQLRDWEKNRKPSFIFYAPGAAGPRLATVTAATDLVCYGLTFGEFRPLVERNGTIAWKPLQA